MNIEEVVDKFRDGPNSVALGPSSLESLANEELWPNFDRQVAVPDNLMRLLALIREGSSEHRQFLIRIIRYFGGRSKQIPSNEDQENNVVGRIVQAINALESEGRLIVINEEMTDPAIQESLGNLYPSSAFEIALSPKRNFLRDYLVRIYSWSKRTGGAILERTRKVFSDIGHHITTIQLPDKLDHYVGLKSRYVGRMFGFRGGKTVKFFVALAISAAGLASTPASIAGVAIALVDP